MKLILDISDNKTPFFLELIKNFDYISIVKQINEKEKSQHISELAEAFKDVKLHEQGKKKLKSAKDLLNEF
jgi:hypothetical protein